MIHHPLPSCGSHAGISNTRNAAHVGCRRCLVILLNIHNDSRIDYTQATLKAKGH